jgi:putative transposase
MFRRKLPAGRPRQVITLSREKERQLDRLLPQGNYRSRMPMRVHVIYWTRHGLLPQEVAAKLHISVATVYRWRARFLAGGAAALVTPRPAFPQRRLPVEKVAAVLRLLEVGALSTRQIAREAGVSQRSVMRLKRRRSIPPS